MMCEDYYQDSFKTEKLVCIATDKWQGSAGVQKGKLYQRISYLINKRKSNED